jgi:hypothetical protein
VAKIMSKLCIFEKSKACDNCGECNICDLNPKKVCNSCGKCLELEGYDMKAIQIDAVLENEEDEAEFEELDKIHTNSNEVLNEDNVLWDLIDDIKDLKELLGGEGISDSELVEEFPGLITYKNTKEEK